MSQEIIIKVVFKVEHSPDKETHLKEVAKAFFASKGITLSDDLVIEV